VQVGLFLQANQWCLYSLVKFVLLHTVRGLDQINWQSYLTGLIQYLRRFSRPDERTTCFCKNRRLKVVTRSSLAQWRAKI